MAKQLMTKQGFDALQKEYNDLAEKRKDALLDLSKARELGDLSENGYYKAARQKLSFIDNRTRYLKYLLKEAEIIQVVKSDAVTVGCTVEITEGTKKQTYQIVGSTESDPLEKKISHISPLGKSLIGKKVGEKITLQTPKGETTYTLLRIL